MSWVKVFRATFMSLLSELPSRLRKTTLSLRVVLLQSIPEFPIYHDHCEKDLH